MKIYTSYYARVNNLINDGIVPISISLYNPPQYIGLKYRKLAPTIQTLSKYKSNPDTCIYTEMYRKSVLDRLEAKKVVDELESLSKGRDVALICYEKYDKFCHRFLVAGWLTYFLGIDVKEYM